MNRSNLRVAVVFAGALSLVACENADGIGGMGKGQTLGTAGGAIAGGLAGYAISGGTLGTVIGVAAGALIGNRLGNWLEGDSQKAAGNAAARAAESGEKVTWKKTGTTFQTTEKGWASPEGSAYTSNGKTCRKIKQSATKGGETREDTVTLCKGDNGWTPA